MTEPRLLVANEAGAGRGHVTKLRQVAEAFPAGLPVVAALASQRFAGELAPLCEKVLRAPPLAYTREALANPELEGNASWADYLAACGLARAEVIRRGLDWWRRVIVDEDISVLVADYAPLAMRAAQGLKADGWEIEIIAAGTGYGVPPAHLERFPVLIDEFRRVVHPEEEVLSLLNRVGLESGLDPLPRLAALYEADLALPFTFEFLDPYRGLRGEGALAAPLVDLAPGLPRPAGDELFVYFSAREPVNAALVDALAGLPLKRFGYLPGAPAGALARLEASGMTVLTAPLTAAEISARARLVLTAAPHGTLCMATLAGLPQVALPRNLEQEFHGRRAAAEGVLRLPPGPDADAGTIRELVREAWADRGLRDAARDLAQRLRSGYPADPKAELAGRLAPLVARARRATG